MATIIDDKREYDRIMFDLRKLGRTEILVGIHSFAGKNNGVNIAEYAAKNEFGDENIPARPFVSTAFDENYSKYETLINNNFSGLIADTISLKHALGKIAYTVSGDIVKKIDSIYTPPNAPSTVERKTKQGKKDKPLIDTGRMRSSVWPVIKGVAR